MCFNAEIGILDSLDKTRARSFKEKLERKFMLHNMIDYAKFFNQSEYLKSALRKLIQHFLFIRLNPGIIMHNDWMIQVM